MDLRCGRFVSKIDWRAQEMLVRIGVPIFGYQNFRSFEKQVERQGHYTVNLGDNMQSLAIRALLRRIGVREENIVSVNRDELRTYAGPPIHLIMNAAFFDHCFPISNRIRPIFIGFAAEESVLSANLDYFRLHQPIGCRDLATKAFLQSHNVEAYVSGCLTMTLPARTKSPDKQKLFLVFGANAGVFPAQVLKYVPAHLSDTAEFIPHRIPRMGFPLSTAECLQIERYVERLLLDYRERATLVLTPLHHAATPCLALGIPTIICRSHADWRFSYLSELLPIYTPERFSEIDWCPAPVELGAIKATLEEQVVELLVRENLLQIERASRPHESVA
jgi:hypothetical protein